MSAREEHCHDGWLFLNEQPTFTDVKQTNKQTTTTKTANKQTTTKKEKEKEKEN